MIVRTGFTAALEGKKLPSTTYRLVGGKAKTTADDYLSVSGMSDGTRCVSHDTMRSGFTILEILYFPLKILWQPICYTYSRTKLNRCARHENCCWAGLSLPPR